MAASPRAEPGAARRGAGGGRSSPRTSLRAGRHLTVTALRGTASLVLGAVAEVRGQPPLRLRDRPALAPGVVLDLVAPDAPEVEVPGARVREVQPADGRARPHGHALGELDARALLD